MKWIVSLSVFFALTVGILASGTDDQYLDIYNQILQADSLQQGNHLDMAAVKYRDALTALQKLHDDHPEWNPAVVNFRLTDLTDKVHQLSQYLAATNSAASVAVARPAIVQPQDPLAIAQQQIAALSAANTDLQMKLKEALSVQPAAVAPSELAKAEEKILVLQKDRDLLTVTVDQLKAAKAAAPAPSSKATDELAALKTHSQEEAKLAKSEISSLKDQLEKSEKQLHETSDELATIKAHPPVSDNVKKLTAERDQLKKELAAISKELADRDAHANVAPAPANEEALNLKLTMVQKERDDLAKQLAAQSQPAAPPGQSENTGSPSEVETLRARLAVLEAAAVPYTPEELAVIHATPPTLVSPIVVAAADPPAASTTPVVGNVDPPAPAATNAPSKHVAHSMKDLPAGAGTMMADAQRAAMEHDYVLAEKTYQDVLLQDPDNVYVLVSLGNTQFDEGHLDDCEKNARRALALDPDDPAALYLLGVLSYRQEKMDTAFDALSRSASINPTNANTQYGLGRVLADKGMQSAAETAFRKTLELQPDHADAHYGLALVYAMEKPPSIALARWHYQRALDLGHPANSNLETLLAGGK